MSSPGASHRTAAQCGSSLSPFPNGRRLTSRATRAPLSLGYWFNSMGRVPTGTAIDAKSGCSRGKQQKEALHKPGVVSRVPRRSRSADAGETDRNTYRTGGTHQQQQGSKRKAARRDGSDRKGNRWQLAQRPRIDCNWTAGRLPSSGGVFHGGGREARCLARRASGTVRPERKAPERKARPPLLSFWFRYPRMRWFPANWNSSGPTLRGSCIG